MSGRFENPYCDPRQGLAAQAWDQGSEYATRVVRHSKLAGREHGTGHQDQDMIPHRRREELAECRGAGCD
jgi:hypothetical protein